MQTAMSRRLLIGLLLCAALGGAENKPERLEWFRDLGFGLFIHWSLDSQVGSVISHSMVGASEDYLDRYVEELPKTFNPKRFDPVEWARLAKSAGFQYVVFTAKHHSGFCMFATKTTEFSIMHTPFARDATREIIDAFRAEGIVIGLYYSPDDFWFLRRQGTLISRRRPEVFPSNNAELMAYDKTHIEELLTHYGKIDILFIDGPPEGLRELAWEIEPDIVVTRGAIETPEQYTPGLPLEGAWEGNLTMGRQWQHRPTNETYKSGTELIKTLIETRAKGGNLLLNIGPRADGSLASEEEGRLREIALWNMVNREAILGVRTWVVTNEGPVWFTKAKDENTVYAFVTGEPWPYAQERTLTLKSVQATAETRVSVLGQNDRVVEYRPEVTPETRWERTPDGLRITATRAQRLYNDRSWPNPVVLKITNAEPGLRPPEVTTLKGDRSGRRATLVGELKSPGDGGSFEVGFEWRKLKDMADLYAPDDPWKSVSGGERSAAGRFEAVLEDLEPGQAYEFRAWAEHPAITVYGPNSPLP